MTGTTEPFLKWPGWRVLGFGLLLGTAQTLWFALIFGGADFITSLHSYRVRLHLTAELNMPFVPWSVLGYMSIYPLFWAAPFILRSPRELAGLTATLAAVTLLAGICFLLFPADLLFPPSGDMGAWTPLVTFAKRLALEHNLMPSLHVALSVVCVTIYAARTGSLGKVILWLWSLVIALSTLLLHQHYLIDVVTGYGLGIGGVHVLYRRWTAPVALTE
jgi:membrane-associated phospholipid phosphatase